MYNQIRMKSSSLLSRFRSLFSDTDGDLRSVWPFFLILTLVLLAGFGWAVYQNPNLRQPGLFFPLLGLLILHITLHWISPFVANNSRWVVPMLGIHVAFAFILVTVSRSTDLAFPVYMGLIGQTVGILQKNWQRIAGIAVILSLSILNLQLLGDRNTLTTWYTVVAPMTIFVVIYVVLYTREAYARSKAQILARDLEEANTQLAEYADRIEQLERQRMARELHDTLAQGLAGLILQLEAADSHLSSQHTERAQQIVQQAMQRARTTLADARRAIDNLRATSHDTGDLMKALKEEVQRFEMAAGVPCKLEVSLFDTLPAVTSEHILRMVSEGLANITRHARAEKAWVSLHQSDNQLSVEIGDDGVGFEPAAGITGSGHYGLLGMRERARLAGGTFDILSAPDQGTILTMRLPL
jgi:two-component system, NarL family, sensor histidine kinase YdfH